MFIEEAAALERIDAIRTEDALIHTETGYSSRWETDAI